MKYCFLVYKKLETKFFDKIDKNAVSIREFAIESFMSTCYLFIYIIHWNFVWWDNLTYSLDLANSIEIDIRIPIYLKKKIKDNQDKGKTSLCLDYLPLIKKFFSADWRIYEDKQQKVWNWFVNMLLSHYGENRQTTCMIFFGIYITKNTKKELLWHFEKLIF